MAKKRPFARVRRAAARASRRVATKAGPGRPRVHDESWSKVSVVLFDRQIDHLERLSARRPRAGRSLNRAEIIRALIDGLIDSGMDITRSTSEADLRARIARRLGSAVG